MNQETYDKGDRLIGIILFIGIILIGILQIFHYKISKHIEHSNIQGVETNNLTGVK